MIISEAESYPLKPREFVVGSTAEKIGMLIDGRSTLARPGISFTQSAMIVDTGQASKEMTLEIVNAGPNPVLLYPGMRFCRACCFLIDPPSSKRYDTTGRYQTGDDHLPKF